MPEQEEQNQTTQEEAEIYDNRRYVINIHFHGAITNLHIEQYGKPISPPPPPPGGE